MSQKPDQPSSAGGVQVFELTMDNPEDQDDLNRRLRKSGESESSASPKNGLTGAGGVSGDEVLERLAAIEWTYADHDPAALAELKRRIEDRARTPNPLQSYSELADGVVFHLPNVAGGTPYQIDTSAWISLDRAIIGDFLGRAVLDSYRTGRFFASALVIQKREQRPSEPFYGLAKQVEILRENSEDARDKFWFEQVRLAVDWFVRHPQQRW